MVNAGQQDEITKYRILLKWFCDRVEKEEIRSHTTYEAFKLALAGDMDKALAITKLYE